MKTAVIYWSQTGNTEALAKAAAEGAGVTAQTVSEFSGNVEEFDAFAFGCPAMGAEVLEEEEFDPFFTSIEGKLSGKKVLLFGSYGWGDGQWMRDWEERSRTAGAVIAADSVICNDAPGDEETQNCKDLGAALA